MSVYTHHHHYSGRIRISMHKHTRKHIHTYTHIQTHNQYAITGVWQRRRRCFALDYCKQRVKTASIHIRWRGSDRAIVAMRRASGGWRLAHSHSHTHISHNVVVYKCICDRILCTDGELAAACTHTRPIITLADVWRKCRVSSARVRVCMLIAHMYARACVRICAVRRTESRVHANKSDVRELPIWPSAKCGECDVQSAYTHTCTRRPAILRTMNVIFGLAYCPPGFSYHLFEKIDYNRIVYKPESCTPGELDIFFRSNREYKQVVPCPCFYCLGLSWRIHGGRLDLTSVLGFKKNVSKTKVIRLAAI